MAIIVQFAAKGMNQTKYAEVMRRLDAAGAGAPKGRIHHVCYGPADALRVVDVYDTPASFEAFGKALVPILNALEIDIGKPDVMEVNNIVRG